MTYWKTLLALLTGAILLSFNTACDIESPGDDDDDDATVEFDVTVEAYAPDGFVGTIEIINDEVLATCTDADFCTTQSPYPDTHMVTFAAWNILCFDKVFEITDADDETTIPIEFDFYADCGLSPEGTYDAYDVECDSKDGHEPTEIGIEVYTETFDHDGITYFGLYGLPGGLIINGDAIEIAGSPEVADGSYINHDLTEIFLTNGSWSSFYCLVE